MKSTNATCVFHYHARFRKRSMRDGWKSKQASRKGAKAQRAEESLRTVIDANPHRSNIVLVLISAD
jgi:hypothetical protein